MPVISTNTAANTALRYLNSNSADQSSSIARLSSGSRITKASDDAAGLAIGTRISSDVTTLNQAATNATQGSAILQIADGALARISDILERMKALATSSNSGAVTDNERTLNDAEYQELGTEIAGIVDSTTYNGETLLDTTTGQNWEAGVEFQVGAAVTDTITVSIVSTDLTALGLGGYQGCWATLRRRPMPLPKLAGLILPLTG